MKNYILLAFSVVFFYNTGIAQSDGCSAATAIAITSNCSSPVNGTTAGATQTIAGCVGTADDDVWYKFTATATSHNITVGASAGFDPVLQLFSGSCSTLNSIACMDQGLTGDDETIFASGLTIGTVYTLRIYHYSSGSGSATFTLCVTPGSSAPLNDDCANATTLNVNTTCSYTSSTTYAATLSQTGCAGTADDDVWFKFVATNSVQTITVDPSSAMDPVVELFSSSGTCASLTSITCMDNTFTDGVEQIDAVGLIPGNTYYIRVYDYYSNTGGAPFQICIVGTPTPTPTNDEPCGAIQMPAVTSDCNYLFFTTTNATNSVGPAAPSNCENWDGTYYGTPNAGGFSTSSKDVWFAITVPSNGIILIMPKPNYGITDGAMALYSGTCSSLTQIACSDDYNYPGTSHDFQPHIFRTGLTPNSTVYLRYWKWGSTTGDFAICVSSPSNDACSSNLYICDLNNYAGTTSAAYTVDRPCNMRANAEEEFTYTWTNGTCQPGGIFGEGGAWGVGAPACDVQINNNSWIKFTAANTSATLTVNIFDCFKGSYPSGGIQMQMFSAGSECCNFTPASDFKEGSSQLTITANNLTIGQEYYLMIDGFGGDICSYSITATGGVQFPDITTASTSICLGETITLQGPDGASSYLWLPGGQTSQNITVTPDYSQTYDLEVTGVCGDRQYLSISITVNNPPTITCSSNSPICQGQTMNLTSSGGATYSWSGPGGYTSSAQNPSRANATTLMNGTYYVTVTSSAGCTSTSSINVLINGLPTAGIGNLGPYCAGETISLSSSGGNSYSWSGPASWTSNSQNPSISNATTSMGGTYYVTVTDLNNCSSTNNTVVTVNSNPNPTADNGGPYCEGQTIALSATGGSTYSWSGPGGWTGTGSDVTGPGATSLSVGTYQVTVTNSNNCSATTSTTVSLYSNPVATASNSGPYCVGETIELDGGGGVSYAWSGPSSFSSGVENPTRPTATAAMAGNYSLTVTNSNNCTATTTTSVVINNNPIANAGSDFSIANGASTTLSGSASGGSGSYSYLWSPSSLLVNAGIPNPQTVNLSSTSTFTVTVTDQSTGCTGTDGVVITITGGPLSVNVTANSDSICLGQSTQLFAQGSGGSGTYTYSWSSSPAGFTSTDANPTVSPTVTTTYHVTINDGFNNSNGSVTVTVNPIPTVTIGNTGPYCLGETIELNASGGINYQWNGPDGWVESIQNPNRPNSTAIMAGVYNVTVTNSFSCTNTSTTTVVLHSNPTAFASNTGPYCVGDTIFLSASGGNNYLWSGPGGWSSNIQNPDRVNASLAMDGTYNVTVSDGNGCTGSIATEVFINANPVVDAGNNVSIPYGTTTILNANVSGGSGNYLYNWTPSDSLINSNVSNPQTNQLTETTLFTVLVTDIETGCFSTDEVTVTITGGPLNLVINANTTEICLGESVQLQVDVSGGSGTYDYNWSSNPMGFTSTIANPNVSPSISTTYNVVVSDGFNSTNTDITITVHNLPVATASNGGPYCADGISNVALYATGGNQYTWSGICSFTSTEQNPQINTATLCMNGMYYVTVTSINGCTATASTIVDVFAPPVVNALTNSNYCFGDSIRLSANGANSYLWTGPQSFTSIEQNPIIYPASSIHSGIYNVVGTNNNGCSDSSQVTVYYPDAINIAELISIDDASNLGVIDLTVTGGTSPYTYLWSNGTSNEDINSLISGNYMVTVTSADLCKVSKSFTIDIPLIIPNVITPNNDQKNDDFEIVNIGYYEKVVVRIYNRWGDLIFHFSGTGLNYYEKENRWNGKENGKPLPMGSYLYIINIDDLEPVTGSVLVKY